MSAILFGSISTLVDSSELQREAFNQAFVTHGLAWAWTHDEYLAMLQTSGGVSRIAEYARSRGEVVDATAVHATKSQIFQQSLAASPVSPRDGVLETMRAAREAGTKLGWVTTTSPTNVSALFEALAPDVRPDSFDVVVTAADVDQVKPDPAAYVYALQRLGEEPGACVAIEDNVDGVRAAVAAGVPCVAFPNSNTTGHTFASARLRVERLAFDDLRQLVTAGS